MINRSPALPFLIAAFLLPVLCQAEEDLPYDPSLLPEDYHSPGKPPPEGQSIRKYAVDEPGNGATNFGVSPVKDNTRFTTLSIDRLEWRKRDGNSSGLWDMQGWSGRDFNKLVVESEGEWSFEEDKAEKASVELFYSRVVDRYWELHVGVRYDIEPSPNRWYAALGLEGLARQWFETEVTLYLSEQGDVSAALELEYDLLFTQRLILQPRLETEVAAQDVPELQKYAGFTGLETGLRLRYEISRKFAPYLGISREQALGVTADHIRKNGGNAGGWVWVLGIKGWF